MASTTAVSMGKQTMGETNGGENKVGKQMARKQIMRIDNEFSESLEVPCGTHKGQCWDHHFLISMYGHNLWCSRVVNLTLPHMLMTLMVDGLLLSNFSFKF